MKQFRAGLLALFAKVGPKLLSVLAKALKGAKVTKIGLAAGSAASYAYLFSWEFAVVIMAVLFIHEYGHIWAMKRVGIHTKGIYFIPFMGAAAVADNLGGTRWKETYTSAMGPIFGLILCIPAMLLYQYTNSKFFLAVTSWIIFITLFNLLPINPLDGGRIIKSCVFSLHSKAGLITMFLMFAACMVFLFKTHSGLFIFLGFIAAAELLSEWFKSSDIETVCTAALMWDAILQRRLLPFKHPDRSRNFLDQFEFQEYDYLYLNGKKMFKAKKLEKHLDRYRSHKMEYEVKQAQPDNKTVANCLAKEFTRNDVEVKCVREIDDASNIQNEILFTVSAKNFKFVAEEIEKMSFERTLISIAIYCASILVLWHCLNLINIPEADVVKMLMN